MTEQIPASSPLCPGDGFHCFIIAEAGVNHNGSLGLALQLVDAAVAAGANAIKFQTFKADKIVTHDAPKAAYQKRQTGAAESQFEMIRRLELTPEDHRRIFNHCQSRNIVFLSTPFDEESADLLEELGVPAFKIPSGEITNYRLLGHVARKRKPIILSTGMSRLGEVEEAIQTIESEGNLNITLLHTVSNYPASPKDVNLRAMRTLKEAFGKPVGYSDHTLGNEVSFAAVALGACVIEKHLTLDRRLPGPDHAASAEPAEFKAMVDGVRTIELALGDGRKVPRSSERDVAAVARRSVVAATDLPAGTRLSTEHLALKRPGTGLPPSLLQFVLGRTLRCDVRAGTLLTLEMLS